MGYLTYDWPHETLWLGAGDVRIEVPTRHLAESLSDRLEPGFLALPEQEGDIWVVDVLFGSANGLASLLRLVEAWVGARGLGAVRYHLDEKAYILSGGEVAWSTFDREVSSLDARRSVPGAAAREGDCLEP